MAARFAASASARAFSDFPMAALAVPTLAVGEKGIGRLVERRARLGVARRRLDLGRVERWLEQSFGVGDDGELLVLILRHEALQGERARHLGQLVETLRERRGLVDRRA